MAAPLLVAENVSKTFRMGSVDVPALRDVSVALEAGELVALTGPSGSGKSTLLSIFSGLARPTAGRVCIQGADLSDMAEAERSAFLAGTCGYIFQSFNLIDVLSAQENVELPLWEVPISRSERRARAVEMLEKVGLGTRLNHRPAQLSGGQQQRVSIARALVRRPKILFADEPTANLDAQASEQIMALIQELNTANACLCIVSTHDPDIVAYTSRKIRLLDGRVVA
ncbi:ABC transporter ATP-binding protein [Salinarimonas sp.]|uniref:ABC transporter ATP-binding protein n=1 Tax=Salinarimonas sp. TaxID=2766526 RepID=UPI0032D9A9C8